MNEQEKNQILNVYRENLILWDSRDLAPVLYGACGMQQLLACF